MYNYDVIIIGGGTSGISAALSASLEGFKVAIIEKQNSLTGTQANALVSPFMPTFYNQNKVTDLIIDNYQKYDIDHQNIKFGTITSFNPEIFKYSVEKLLTEHKVDIFYDCAVFEIGYNDEQKIDLVKAIFLDQIIEFKATYYVDASANLIIPSLLGFDAQKGNEKGQNQASSLRFEIANINFQKLRSFLQAHDYKFCDLTKNFLEFVYVPNHRLIGTIGKYFEQAVKTGELKNEDIRYIQGFSMPSAPNVLNFNGPQIENVYDVLDPLQYSKMTMIGREMQNRLAKFLKSSIPGFEHSYISKSATMLGIRESKRLIGKYIMNEKDYLNRQKFPDGIAKGDWYIDIHDDSLEVENEQFKVKYDDYEYYEIPYRSLVTEKIKNCLFIGRHISANFKMQSSVRIQFTCYAMGNIVGQAIKQAKTTNQDLNNIDGKILKQYLIDGEK